jgi:ribosome-associated protein
MTDTPSNPQPVDGPAAELAIAAARAIDDKKGEDIVILEVGPILGITELFVITSASNRRLVRTIVDEVEEQVYVLLDRKPLRVEGLTDQQWVLLDYGDVVVHVFGDEARRFYEIERLYKDVPRVEWRPVGTPEAPAPSDS